ncbi:unnamed protein product [Calypogeia fissa]
MAALGAACNASAAVAIVPRMLLHRTCIGSSITSSNSISSSIRPSAALFTSFAFPFPSQQQQQQQQGFCQHFSVISPSSSSSFLPKVPAQFYHRSGSIAMSPSKSPSPVKAVLTAEVGLTKPAETTLPDIAVTATDGDVTQWKGDLLVVGVFEGEFAKNEAGAFEDSGLKALDGALGGILGDILTEEDFAGKAGKSSSARVSGHGFKRLVFVGLGKPETAASSFRVWNSLGESIATAAKPAKATSAAVVIANPPELSPEAKVSAASAITSGAVLGSFEDLRFKSESKNPVLNSIEIFGLGSGPELEEKLSQTVKLASGVMFAKQLVNAPPNVLIPSVLADEAENLAAEFSDVLTVKILDEEACKELKMGSYLGVAIASTNPPKFIHLQYKPPTGEVKTKLAIVGKGLTFDSGGYNLKTGAGSMIELMKFDMGGAAAAIGAAKAVAAVKPLGVEVHFIVAACENMISGGGMRPGDILTASNGKTIEVNNTDAEGRLTLADALVYACNLKVDKIVDLATLTGACIVALGNDIGGMFTPNDDLAAELSSASKSAGEKLWRMPMEESYWDMMKSGIADMVNTGGRPGGSITAALFLKQFVDENIAWAHLDIAGPVWSNEKKGATGFAVATLLSWVQKHSS